jgi:hypothetical protein
MIKNSTIMDRFCVAFTSLFWVGPSIRSIVPPVEGAEVQPPEGFIVTIRRSWNTRNKCDNYKKQMLGAVYIRESLAKICSDCIH